MGAPASIKPTTGTTTLTVPTVYLKHSMGICMSVDME